MPPSRSCDRRFEATEARILRVVLSGFYDMALVVSKTFLEFDDEAQESNLING